MTRATVGIIRGSLLVSVPFVWHGCVSIGKGFYLDRLVGSFFGMQPAGLCQSRDRRLVFDTRLCSLPLIRVAAA
jgi:hypothetical protein